MAGWFVRRFMLGDRRGGPWAPPADVESEPVSFPGNTGARLSGRYFPNHGARGVVVCVHPDRRYAGHWFVRSGWVRFLLDAGYEVLTFDLTCYGGSRGPATYYAEDVREAVRFARRWSGGLETHVVGVSMGAHAAASASPWLDDVGGLVLESPPANLMAFAKGRAARLGVRVFNVLFRRTAALIQADKRITRGAAQRILIAATAADEVTRIGLTRQVAQAAPPERTRYLEFADVPHLGLFELPEYRAAVLHTLAGGPADPREVGTPHLRRRSSNGDRAAQNSRRRSHTRQLVGCRHSEQDRRSDLVTEHGRPSRPT